MPCKTAPALITFRNEANALAPGRSKDSDGSCPSADHHQQNPSSDHEPNAEGWSRAYDLDEKLGLPGLDPDKPLLPLAPHLVRDYRTKYIIYEKRIYYPDGTVKPYSGLNAHNKHLHLSIKNEYVLDTSAWHVADAFKVKAATEGPAVPYNEEDDDMKCKLIKIPNDPHVWAYRPGYWRWVRDLEELNVGIRLGFWDGKVDEVNSRERDKALEIALGSDRVS
jgi:hypothetical protein